MVVHAELKHSFGVHPRQLLDLMHDDKGDFVRRYALQSRSSYCVRITCVYMRT